MLPTSISFKSCTLADWFWSCMLQALLGYLQTLWLWQESSIVNKMPSSKWGGGYGYARIIVAVAPPCGPPWQTRL